MGEPPHRGDRDSHEARKFGVEATRRPQVSTARPCVATAREGRKASRPQTGRPRASSGSSSSTSSGAGEGSSCQHDQGRIVPSEYIPAVKKASRRRSKTARRQGGTRMVDVRSRATTASTRRRLFGDRLPSAGSLTIKEAAKTGQNGAESSRSRRRGGPRPRTSSAM